MDPWFVLSGIRQDRLSCKHITRFPGGQIMPLLGLLHVGLLIGGSKGCATDSVLSRSGTFPFGVGVSDLGKHSSLGLIKQVCLGSPSFRDSLTFPKGRK